MLSLLLCWGITNPPVLMGRTFFYGGFQIRRDAWRGCALDYYFVEVSQVTSGPRRGPTFNNRWWNDRRSWNLRIILWKEKSSPKGANHIQSCSCSPPLGTIRECVSAIRRFHSLRSFHPRLFTFAPFGDGRMPLAKDLLFCYCIAVFIKNGAIGAYLPFGREIVFQCIISRLILYFECASYVWVCFCIIQPIRAVISCF